MSTIRLSLSKGIVLIPGNKNKLELVEILGEAFNGVKVKILKTNSVIVLNGSVATTKPTPEWISNEITQKNNDILDIKRYVSELKKL